MSSMNVMPTSRSGYRQYLLRKRTTTTDRGETKLARAIVEALPEVALERVEMILPHESMFYLKGIVVLKVTKRVEVIDLLRLMPPVPLVRVTLEDKHRIIWVSTHENHTRKSIVGMEQIAPFTYTVKQGRAYGPLCRVAWATRVGEMMFAVQADIANDPAKFILHESESSVKWERNKHFPRGKWFGRWGHWSPTDQDEGAHMTVVWPFSVFENFETNHPLSMARRVLESEGHNAAS